MTMIDSMTAQTLHDLGVGRSIGDLDGFWDYIADQVEGDSRWHRNHLMVVSDPNGEHWGLPYRVGATEEQEHDYPWEGHEERLTLTRLYPHQVTTIVYRTEPDEVAK